MRQHNPPTNNHGRNFWKTARDRNRLHARYSIQQRAGTATTTATSCTATTTTTIHSNGYDDTNCSQDDGDGEEEIMMTSKKSVKTDDDPSYYVANSSNPNNNKERERARVQEILLRIVQGDRSFFSLHTLETNHDLFEQSFSASYLWERDNGAKEEQDTTTTTTTDHPAAVYCRQLWGEEHWFSRLGKEVVQTTFKKKYLSNLTTCTFLDYAIWLKRYFVVGSFIMGGISPYYNDHDRDCHHRHPPKIRHREIVDHEEDLQRQPDDNDDDGSFVEAAVRKRLVNKTIPLPMATYIVKRVVDMRRAGVEQQQVESDTTEGVHAAAVAVCGCCDRRRPPTPSYSERRPLLRFVPRDYYSQVEEFNRISHLRGYCCHRFCELCFWKDILEHMDGRQGDVVQCPVCVKKRNHDSTRRVTDEGALAVEAVVTADRCESDHSSCNDYSVDVEIARTRRIESLEKYQKLPADGKSFKDAKVKKKKLECDALASTWSEAVRPSLGITQSIRVEKFFVFAERLSYHFVKGCLDAGIDVNLQNEYGQTALFIAVWRGDVKLARLLLAYGCDPNLPANGFLTCLRVARTLGYEMTTELLIQAGGTEDVVSLFPLCDLPSNGEEDFGRLKVSVLIDWSQDHPGAGSFLLDGVLSDAAMDSINRLWKTLPVETPSRKKKDTDLCSERRYYCDTDGSIIRILTSMLVRAQYPPTAGDEAPVDESQLVHVFPHMRFLCYQTKGSSLPPHRDLNRVDASTGLSSTHSFLLYLTDCEKGGETSLIGDLAGEGREVKVKPRRGRLLLFPHRCGHEGLVVDDVPKLLIRGEVWLSNHMSGEKTG